MELRDKNLNISKTLRSLSYHNFIGLCSIFLLGFVDSFFLGMKGEIDFATAIFSSPIIFFIISMFIGISNAKMVFISKGIDRGQLELNKEGNYIDLLILFSFILVAILLISNVSTVVDIFSVEPALRDSSITYITIHYIAGIFCVYNTLTGAYLRGMGDSRIPARVMTLTSVINIVLDPLFIFHFDMGSTGAAYATAIAWITSSLYMTYYLRIKRKLPFTIKKIVLSDFIPTLPSFVVSQALNTATVLIVFYMIANFGTNVLSGLGFGIRLDKFVVIISFAFGGALSVFVGQNLKDSKRCIEGYKSAFIHTIVLSLFMSILLYLGSSWIAIGFGLKAETVSVLELFLIYNIFTSLLNAVYVLNSSYLNSSNYHNVVLRSNIIKTFITLPIFLYVFIELYDWHGALIALFVNALFSNIILILLSSKETRKQFLSFFQSKTC